MDKLSVSVFLAAAGSKLNVSSLPFLLSYEGGTVTTGHLQSEVPYQRIGPFPNPLSRALAANFVPQNHTVLNWECLR